MPAQLLNMLNGAYNPETQYNVQWLNSMNSEQYFSPHIVRLSFMAQRARYHVIMYRVVVTFVRKYYILRLGEVLA